MILFGSFPFSSINILKCGNSVSRFDNIFLGQGRGVWSVTKNQLFSLRDTAIWDTALWKPFWFSLLS
jgi:hypothetical protein